MLLHLTGLLWLVSGALAVSSHGHLHRARHHRDDSRIDVSLSDSLTRRDDYSCGPGSEFFLENTYLILAVFPF
jgi:hypothetical protein